MFKKSAKQAVRPKVTLSIVVIACCIGFSTIARASCGALTDDWQATTLPPFSRLQGFAPISHPSSFDAKDDANASIVGLWTVTFNSNGQVFDQGIDQWHSDGTEILNDIAAPQPANGSGTVCLGVFKKTGPRSVQLRHPFFSFDSNGNLAATGVILENLTVARSSDTYSGSFSYKVYDLSGNLISSIDGTVVAQRITAD